MKRGLYVVAAGLWASSRDRDGGGSERGNSAAADGGAGATRYCVTCHNDRLKTSGLSLEKLDIANAAANPDIWENVAESSRRARCPRREPPAGRSDLSRAEDAIEAALDAERRGASQPGAPMLHRLNRSEIRERGPRPARARRRRRVAAAARRCGVRLRQYLRCARRLAVAAGDVSDGRRRRSAPLAVGDPDITRRQRHVSASDRICRRTSTSKACRSARSAASGPLHVPARRRLRLPGEAVSHQPEHHARPRVSARRRVRRRRRRVHLATIGGDRRISRPLRQADRHGRRGRRAAARARAGEGRSAHGVGRVRSKIRRSRTPRGCSRSCAARPTTSMGRAGRTCRRSAITGPFNATGPGDTPSRRRIFVVPATSRRRASGVRRADSRRRSPAAPIAAGDADDEHARSLRTSTRQGRKGRDVRSRHRGRARADSRQPAVRVPRRARPGRRGPARRIALSDLELASRLSFFLWSSIPDDELLAVRGGRAS